MSNALEHGLEDLPPLREGGFGPFNLGIGGLRYCAVDVDRGRGGDLA
jgi:hypothetical protein